jgi:Fe-S-cluster containining protein
MEIQLLQQQVDGGLKRTFCSCEICKENCKIIPGYLIPNDLNAIYNFMNPTVKFIDFIKLYFLASPGAIVMKDGNIFRIPTIVPARNKKTNYCIFFTKDEKCFIHKVSPYGCRYFDHSQTREEGENISKYGLNQIIISRGYNEIHYQLWSNNLRAKPPEELRKL